jgi:cyclin H
MKYTDTETKKPQVYEESSQYQHWRFSPEQLWDIRNKSTNDAIQRVKRNVQEELVSLLDLEKDDPIY